MFKEFTNSCKNIFHFGGRIRRREYWVTRLWLYSLLLFAMLLCLPSKFISKNPSALAGLYIIVAGFVLLALLIGMAILAISINIRRCHDIGMGGWVYFLCILGSFLCGIGGIVWLVFCCLDSKDDNKWGPNPKKTPEEYSNGSIALAISVLIILFLLIAILCASLGV